MNLPDLEIRIQQLFDDELTEEQFAELETELLENPEAMDLYLSYSGLESDLKHHASYQETAEKLPVVPIEELLAQQRRRAIRVSLLSAAAVLIIAAVIMWMQQVPNTPDTIADLRVTPGSDFTLSHNTDDKTPTRNVMVENSRIVLRHGVVELKLPHDVRAIIEAPAEMTLRDDRTLELNHGWGYFKISSKDGEGFTVVTPHQRIVDLGTAFGIDSPKGSKEIELHVLEGQVRVDGIDGKRGGIVQANRAVMLADTRVLREIDNPSISFRHKLPPKINTLVKEDFASGLISGHNYVIRMDKNVIRDPAGNSFGGINDDTTWNFNTLATTTTVLPTSATWNYFHPLDAVDPAIADPDFNTTWYTQNDAGNSYDGPTFAGSGSGLFGYGSPGGRPNVDIGTPGSGKRYTAYFTTTFDLGAISASSVTALTANIMADDGAFIYINGKLAANYHTSPGNDTYLAGMDGGGNITVSTNITLDQSLLVDGVNSIAVSVHQKSNDSSDLGFQMAVKATFEPVSEPSSVLGFGDQTDLDDDPAQAPPTSATRDDSPPVFIATYPADDSINATQGGQMKMLFNEPIKLGTGSVFIQNVTNWSESTLVVGDHRLSIDDLPSQGDSGEAGKVLTINPPIELKDGAQGVGWLAGWQTDAPVTFINPRGDGIWYDNDDLQDDRKSLGMTESMRSPGMASINQPIHRKIGTITADNRYTVSAAIGVRAKTAKNPSTFPGYTIRLKSGDITLAQLTSNTPPGPANSVNTVGFSWDATTLPKDVNPGDPLSIEIIPHQTSGYLDLNALRISTLGQSGR
ncbi:MAG: FecR domain-containing protein [Verrucomicrobiae bacterium]|nr:FecR domain-containing protein [Verrucomicrobiae bacterium]NNJ44045.1 hypothetical protein [Akkermansiaceae bacterium]